MARPTLFSHPKLRRLAYILAVPVPHAVGHLECLWHVAYEAGQPVFRDRIDVELAAQWQGEQGKLCEALVEVRLLDVNAQGNFSIHDFHDHCPDYVRLRSQREGERKKRYGPRGRSQPAQSDNADVAQAAQAANQENHVGLIPTITDDNRPMPTNSDERRLSSVIVPTPSPTPTPSPAHTLPYPSRQGFSGSAGESGNTEESVCEGERRESEAKQSLPARPMMPCDNPELAQIARRVLEHYQRVVHPASLPGQAIPALMVLLDSRNSEALLRRCADGYAAWCASNDQKPRYRKSAEKFFAWMGDWTQFAEGSVIGQRESAYKPTIAKPIRERKTKQGPATLADSLPDFPPRTDTGTL